VGTDDAIDAGLFKFVGRDVLRAFRYNPQALHIVDPAGDRRQSGVWLVPQLLQIWPKAGGTVMGA
jgi:hypothetical protein